MIRKLLIRLLWAYRGVFESTNDKFGPTGLEHWVIHSELKFPNNHYEIFRPSGSLRDKKAWAGNLMKHMLKLEFQMDESLEQTLELIPEDAPGKVLSLLSNLKEKIRHQTTAIDLKKKLISNQEAEKQEVDEKITALELKIRQAKSLKGDSTSDLQERAKIDQDGLIS